MSARANRRRTGRSSRAGARSWLARARRIVLGSLACVLVGAFVIVLSLRWIPPLTTSFMMLARIQHGLGSVDYRWVDLSRISPQAALAVIAAEDQRFPEHHGFDFEAIADALRAADRGRDLRGASTISQQVAKNLFLWPGRSWLRKALEAGWTALIEALWPKRRILEVYLNVIELGPGVFGVESASQRYFKKSAAKLTASEAALLAAVLPNPEKLRVDRPSSSVQRRRAWIQGQMRRLGGTSYLDRLED